MKFAHLADCHIGSWRDAKLRDSSTKAFIKAIDKIIEKDVDFVLISGDLFNTALPSIDRLKIAVEKLKELKDKGINIYAIPGSHDFSHSGKTILDVLEKAGLLVNVVKGKIEDKKLKLNFVIDKKTNVKIAGMLGKKGSLEKKYYESLDRSNLEKETGFKIFMFHSAINELKPKELEKMDSFPVSFLPKNFDYYAGGHVHIVDKADIENYKNIVFPGPLFPNNFLELEKLGRGGFYVYNNGKLEYEPIQIHNIFNIKLDCNQKNPEQIESEILEQIKGKEFNNTIVTIRLFGTLESGKISDIKFKEIFDKVYEKGAYFVMKNTNKLTATEFEEIKIKADSVEEMEDFIVNEHLNQIKISGIESEKEKELTKKLINALNLEREEGEKVAEFEARVISTVEKILDF